MIYQGVDIGNLVLNITQQMLPAGVSEAQLRTDLANYLFAKAKAIQGYYSLPIAPYDLLTVLLPGFTVTPTPLPEQILIIAAQYEQAVNDAIQVECATAGFDDITSACAYAATSNPLQALSASFVNWRAAVWLFSKDILAKVQAGTMAIPALPDYLASLPTRVPPP